MGFAPTRAEHNGLAVHRLIHSATWSIYTSLEHSLSRNLNVVAGINETKIRNQWTTRPPTHHLSICFQEILMRYGKHEEDGIRTHACIAQ